MPIYECVKISESAKLPILANEERYIYEVCNVQYTTFAHQEMKYLSLGFMIRDLKGLTIRIIPHLNSEHMGLVAHETTVIPGEEICVPVTSLRSSILPVGVPFARLIFDAKLTKRQKYGISFLWSGKRTANLTRRKRCAVVDHDVPSRRKSTTTTTKTTATATSSDHIEHQRVSLSNRVMRQPLSNHSVSNNIIQLHTPPVEFPQLLEIITQPSGCVNHINTGSVNHINTGSDNFVNNVNLIEPSLTRTDTSTIDFDMDEYLRF